MKKVVVILLVAALAGCSEEQKGKSAQEIRDELIVNMGCKPTRIAKQVRHEILTGRIGEHVYSDEFLRFTYQCKDGSVIEVDVDY